MTEGPNEIYPLLVAADEPFFLHRHFRLICAKKEELAFMVNEVKLVELCHHKDRPDKLVVRVPSHLMERVHACLDQMSIAYELATLRLGLFEIQSS